jgi:ribosomal protein S18 acetylase RimI-like enzyme
MPEVSVRPATVDDAPALVSLVNSAYRGASGAAGWMTERDLLGGQRVDLEGMVETITTADSVILVHEEGGTPIACVLLERTGDDPYIGMLTVKPATQGSGLGGRLLETAERWLVEHWRARSAHMTVIMQRTELIAWYERRGYVRTGQRKPFPYGNERFGLPLRDDLEFEVLRKALA